MKSKRKKSNNDQVQLKLDLIEKIPPERNAMLVDVSYPLQAYLPGSTCPNCGHKVRPGCPVECKLEK